jgi:hypothetical protein
MYNSQAVLIQRRLRLQMKGDFDMMAECFEKL